MNYFYIIQESMHFPDGVAHITGNGIYVTSLVWILNDSAGCVRTLDLGASNPTRYTLCHGGRSMS